MMDSPGPWSENALFREYWDDGLIDLLAGLALLIAGLGWQSRFGVLAILQAPLWTVLWQPLRQRIVEPRAGYVAFCRARQRRNTRGGAMAVAAGLVALALVVLGLNGWVGRSAETAAIEWAAGLPALIIATMGVLAALLTSARRFFLYAAVSLIAAVAAAGFSWHPGMALTAVGVVVTAGGAWLLTRFLRESRNFVETE